MRKWIWVLAVLLMAGQAEAVVQTKAFDYKDKDTEMEGFLAYDDALTGKRPGILVVHDWMGFGPFANNKAVELAKLGYAAMAVDIYGKGVRPKDTTEAANLAGKFKSDRTLMRERILSAFEVLKNDPAVDPDKVAVMGFCFGGTVSLELARSGAPIKGVVSFHGGLSTPAPEDARNIKAKVLALHGADDPYVPFEEVMAFEKEMRDGGVDWQLISYGRAVHSFTNPAAGDDNSKGAAYNADADRRSWIAMEDFLKEIFR